MMLFATVRHDEVEPKLTKNGKFREISRCARRAEEKVAQTK